MSTDPTPIFPEAADAGPDSSAAEALPFRALEDVSMPVIIEIGRTSLPLGQILRLKPGQVVPLDRLVGEPVDILVSDRKVAEGEIVVLGERFGVRVTRVMGRPAGAEQA